MLTHNIKILTSFSFCFIFFKIDNNPISNFSNTCMHRPLEGVAKLKNGCEAFTFTQLLSSMHKR